MHQGWSLTRELTVYYLLLLQRGAYVEVLNEHHFFRRSERDNSSGGFVSTRVIHLSTEYVQKYFATKKIEINEHSGGTMLLERVCTLLHGRLFSRKLCIKKEIFCGVVFICNELRKPRLNYVQSAPVFDKLA